MGTAKKIGAQPILIANYGSGTPQEAADWVRYANVTKGYGAKYWEIGNELYGNGHYGSGWETDNHADTSPTAYATNLVAVRLGDEGRGPVGQGRRRAHAAGQLAGRVMAAGDSADWNHTVIPLIAGKADFVDRALVPGRLRRGPDARRARPPQLANSPS